MAKLSYMIEVYEPESDKDIICSYFGDSVFPTISKGDILNFPNESRLVRVTEILHSIWENKKQISFKTMIYTKDATF